MLGAEGVQVGRARQQIGDSAGELAARRAGPPPGPAVGGDADQRHGDAAEEQAGSQYPGRRDQDQQAGGDRSGADEHRRERRREAADEQILHGVNVADQPGQQVAGAERAEPGGRQPFQAAVDRDPHIGQDPERDVMRAEPLAVPEDTAADAEGPYRDHRAGDRHDARVL